MFKSFKAFWKDYYEWVLKPTWKWTKKHWFGLIVYCIACFGITWFYTYFVLFGKKPWKKEKKF